MGAMKIVTGYTGVPHITSQQDRDVNSGAYGEGSYILPVGNQFAATISSATRVTLASGAFSLQGCVGVLEYGSTQFMDIESGTVGENRNDLIVVRYKRDQNAESLELAVITGTPSTGTAADPSYTSGIIAAGDNVVEFPLYRVKIEGVAIVAVERIASVIMSTSALTSELGSLASLVDTTRAPFLYFATEQDFDRQMADLPSYRPYMFRGSYAFTSFHFGMPDDSYTSWGIGIKMPGTSLTGAGYHMLAIINHKLYYSISTAVGGTSGNIYNPLNLRTNI